MDAVNSFKEKAERNLANYSLRKKKQDTLEPQNQLETDGVRDLIRKAQENTTQQKSQDATNKALQSSRQQNVQQNLNNGANLNNQIAALNEAKAQEEQIRQAQQEAAKRQQQTKQMSSAESARKNFDLIDDAKWQTINSSIKDSDKEYKNVFGSSVSNAANSYLSNALRKVKGANENAFNSSADFKQAFESLSSDDKWDVYQNIQESKNKLAQALAKADNEQNQELYKKYATFYSYVDMYDNMISDIEKGDKSFWKSLGDWISSGGVAGDLSRPATNAIGDIGELFGDKGAAATSKLIERSRATSNEGNNGVVNAIGGVTDTIGNIGLNVATGGMYGLGTSAEDLGHTIQSAITDQNRQYYVDENGEVQRQNESTASKLANIGTSGIRAGLTIAGMKGFGPNIKFEDGNTLQGLIANKDYGTLLKAFGNYAMYELPWAAGQTALDAHIMNLGGDEQAWQNFGKDFIENVLGDLAVDLTGAIREGNTGNRDLFRMNPETKKLELTDEAKAKLSPEEQARVQENIDEYVKKVEEGAEGRVDTELTRQELVKNELPKTESDVKTSSDAAKLYTELTKRYNDAVKQNNTQEVNDSLKQEIRDLYNQINEIKANNPEVLEQVQKQLENSSNEMSARQDNESATGQQIDPNKVQAVENAEGTQASGGQAEATTGRVDNTTTEQEGMRQTGDLDEGVSEYKKAFDQYEKELNDLGFDEATQKAIQSANMTMQNGKADLSALTKQQQDLYRAILQKLSDAGILKGTVEENFNKGWLPQRYVDSDYLGNGIEELTNTGELSNTSLNARTGAVAASGKMDFSNKPLADLLARASLGDKIYVDATAKMARELGANATPEQVIKASEKVKNAIESVNKAGDAEGTVKIQDTKKIKAMSQYSEAGKELGIPQQKIDAKLSGFSDYEKLQRLGQWWKGLSVGVKENLDSLSLMRNESVDSMISDGFEYVSRKDKASILASRGATFEKYMQKYNGDVELANRYTNREMLNKAWYKNAYKMGFKTEFTNADTKAFMDEVYTGYMIQNRIQKTSLQKFAQGLSRAMNSSFRGLRWQTTLNEIPEIFKNVTDFGKINLVVNPTEINQIKGKYGFTDGTFKENIMSQLTPEQSAQLEADVRAAGEDVRKQTNAIKNFLNKVDSATQWNGFIQNIKDATFLKNAEAFYSRQGLSEPQVRQAVLDAYAARMLPQSRVYKYIKTDSAISKPLLMYLDASARMTTQSARAAIGSNDVGINKSLNRTQRILRNAGTDILPRVISAMVMGVPVSSVFGLFTVGGEDYSGIDDEDKNAIDKIINTLDDFSPLVSMISTAYNNMRQDEIANAKGYNPYDVRGDATSRSIKSIAKNVTPLGNQLDSLFGLFGNQNSTFGNIFTKMSDEELEQYIRDNNLSEEDAENLRLQNLANKGVNERGYGINKNGKVTYLKDNKNIFEEIASGDFRGALDDIIGAVAGENKTSVAREYNNNPDLVTSLMNQASGKDYNGDGKVDGGITDFFRENAAVDSVINNPVLEALGLDINIPGVKTEEEYNRPASITDSSNYNAMIQDAMNKGDTALAQEWYQKSRDYNAIKDNLRVSNPTAVEVYDTSNGRDIISPQKWSIVAYANGQDANNHLVNLDTWNMMKEMAIKRSNDFGTALNPQWLLDDEHASQYLQYKSTATGEDTVLSRDMKVDPFWQDFFTKQREFYNNQGESDWDDSNATQNVQRWNELNDQMSAMYDWDTNLKLRQDYPLMAEYNSLLNALKAKYGDEYKSAPDYKTFWSNYGDAYNEEKSRYNTQMRLIVNDMRSIEGFPPLTEDQWDAIGDFGYSSSSKNYGSGSSDYSYAPEFSNKFNADPYYMQAKNRASKTNLSWKRADVPSFYAVPTSHSNGTDPYSSVV